MTDFDLARWDLFLRAMHAAFCAREFTLHGIFIFCKISIICLEAAAYPILIPGNPKDFVKERKTRRLSYFFTYDITDSFDSGTSSIKHSSTNTIEDSFFCSFNYC